MQAGTRASQSFLDRETYSPNGDSTACETVYKHYKEWCIDNGRKALNSVHFGRNLYRIFPNVKKIRGSTGGKRINEYQGLISIDDAAIVNPENGQITIAGESNCPEKTEVATVKQNVTMADTEDTIPF
ncbi:MAG: primase-like DNA-binding domain-containing protein [Planctomycetota bacterium]